MPDAASGVRCIGEFERDRQCLMTEAERSRPMAIGGRALNSFTTLFVMIEAKVSDELSIAQINATGFTERLEYVQGDVWLSFSLREIPVR